MGTLPDSDRPAVLKPFRALFAKRGAILAFLIGLALSFWLGLWISPILKFSIQQYKIGEYTARAIRAPQDITVLDEETTNKRIDEAARAVFPVYDYDPDMYSYIVNKIQTAFEQIQSLFKTPEVEEGAAESDESSEIIPVIPKNVMNDAEARFIKVLGVTLSGADLQALERARFAADVEQVLLSLVGDVYSKSGLEWSLKSLEETLPEGDRVKGVILRNVKSGEEKAVTNLSTFVDMESAVKNIDSAMAQSDMPIELKQVLAKIAKNLLKPNLSYNLSETERRREWVRQSVQKVVFHYSKNQLIVGEGQPITKEMYNILVEVRHAQIGEQPLFTYLMISIGIYFILVTIYFSSRKVLTEFKPSVKDIAFFAAMLGILVFTSWVWAQVADSLGERFDVFEKEGTQALGYVMPVAAIAMVIGMMMPVEVALVFSILAAIFSGIVLGGGLTLTVAFFIGSLFGITNAHRATTRGYLLRTGVLVGLIQGVAAIVLSLIVGRYQEIEGSKFALFGATGFLGGLLSGPVCIALAPVAEFLFSHSTGIKLLELASLNHPLLKELVVKAPGTYQHSTMTASLAEAGAEAIGANALLAKVAAMYHDVGKIEMPQYFIENLPDQESAHGRLEPQLSAKIIIAHVREGVELAKKYKISQSVIDIISQHHGTSLVRFFYHRAKELENPEMERVEEIQFRYPSEKPRTPEAAIVMMADVVEAATRTLKNPSYTRIQEAVRELIQEILRDGQLDECGLTFRQLSAVIDAFTRLLVATFHQRIEYPEANGGKNGNNRWAKSSKNQKDQS